MTSAARTQSPAPRAEKNGAENGKLVHGAAARAIQRVKNSRMEITDEGLENIRAWQYKGGTYTPADKFLNRFLWTPGANLLPTWLAPNAVTLIGLLWVVLGYLLLVTVYSTDFYEPAPTWVYVFAAAANFIYQTMDAFDGKQARRLGASSPLGQLFDHGCDSVSTTFIAMTIASSCRLGFGVRSVALLFSFAVPFWLSQWAEYHTHMMEHSLGGWLGITEGQLVGIFVILCPAMLGPDFYVMDLDLGSLPAWYCGEEPCAVTPRDLFLWGQLLVALVFVFSSFRAVLALPKAHKTQALRQTVPIFLLMMLGIAWCTTVPHSRKHPQLVTFSLGMAFTFLTNKMIVAGMCRMEYEPWSTHAVLVPLPIIYAIMRLRLLPRHEDVLLGAYVAYGVHKLYKYTFNVVEEISQFLGIYVLHLGHRQKED